MDDNASLTDLSLPAATAAPAAPPVAPPAPTLAPTPAPEPEAARSIVSAAAELTRPRSPQDPRSARPAFESGEFPYATNLTEKEYLQRVKPLQVELLKALNHR